MGQEKKSASSVNTGQSHSVHAACTLRFSNVSASGAASYLSTNHQRTTLPISSASSTKAITRTMLSTSFVTLCSATSFWYSLSSSWYGRLAVAVDSLASSRSRSNSDALSFHSDSLCSNFRTVR